MLHPSEIVFKDCVFTAIELITAIAAEREACAVQADVNASYFVENPLNRSAAAACTMTADMIRARSGQEEATDPPMRP